MEFIIQTLYWISSGLLIPTIVLLLLFLAQGLMVIGGFYGAYANRMAFEKSVKPALHELSKDNANDVLNQEKIRRTGLVNVYLEKLLANRDNTIKAEKVLADFEMACEQDLGKVKTLAKIGPMLGLMGTLIPMGPALVGLASGDMASLAQNMQVAFATTVVGLLIGAIGFFCNQIKTRWYASDLTDLEYVYAVVKN
ncbi:MotA/TolQ/ExbB proton channel family protein [Thalassotalea psychrophila]|uniref:MotA/TolQ/ExbB proton channel family protein n=1 Tax=Thalassotalea psychrophila TaxID=3065647 RepID=A0ABY9TTI5_9GAMM|nr:MotA/TolQ/ExbB proton channel family protein [Colwelliaceae bacterium SQ149]